MRRFALAPLLFALWALWFVLPTTRGAARRDWARVWSPPDANAPSQPLNVTSRDALVARALSPTDKGRAFEELGRRFPNDAAICAGQLLQSASQLNLGSVRQAGPASNADRNWSVKLSKIKRVSPQFLKSWFAATARGAQLEPQNTFWDWTQIMGLRAAQRDGEIWRVLQIARSKTGFDDHQNDLSAAMIRAQRREHGPLAPMDELNLGFSNIFGIYAPMREVARQTSEDAYGLRLQKTAASDKQALEGMRDLALLSRTMRLQSKTIIGSLVGQAMESIALWGGGFTPANTRRGRSLPGAKTLAKYAGDSRSLLFFARAQKRGDVAALLSGEWISLGVWRAKTRSMILKATMEGMNESDFTLASAGDWLGWRLLATMPALLLLGGLCSLALRLVPALRRERETLAPRASWLWGAFLSVLSVLILASSMLWRVGAMCKAMGISPLRAGFAMIYDPLSLSTDSNTFSGAPRSWDLAFPAALLFVSALWFAASWDAKRRDIPTLGARLKRLFHAPDDGLTRFDASPVLALIGLLSAASAASAGVLAFLIVPAINSDSSLHEYAGWVLFGFAFVLALPAWWRLRTWAGRALALQLALRFAWAGLLCLSVLWGVLTLATAPAHRRFEAQLDRYLRVGEFQLARQRLGV